MFVPKLQLIASVIVALTLAACAAEPANPSPPGSASLGLELSDEVVDQTLAFLNDEDTDFQRLDEDCRFYSNAARQTIKHRNGQDRDYPSGDDDVFDSWDEFMAVSDVGPAHGERAVECAVLFGFVAATCTSSDTVIIDWYDDLSPELQAFVDAELAFQQATATPVFYGTGTFRFYEAETDSACGVVTGHRVRLGRTIDLGITETIDYTLDADLNILDEYWDAG